MSGWDWFGLALEALPTLGIVAIFLNCVWTDAIEPWLYQRDERRRMARRG